MDLFFDIYMLNNNMYLYIVGMTNPHIDEELINASWLVL